MVQMWEHQMVDRFVLTLLANHLVHRKVISSEILSEVEEKNCSGFVLVQ